MTRSKTDCFAYKPGQQNPRRKAECTALDKLYCKEGECSFYKDRQDMAGYPESEYGTPKPSAAALIRAQGEQIEKEGRKIKHMSAEEYLKDKIGSDADGRIQPSGIPGACRCSCGTGGEGL